MLLFKDFDTCEELEQFQNEDRLAQFEKVETIQKQVWVQEFYDPNLQLTSGYKTISKIRYYYHKVI